MKRGGIDEAVKTVNDYFRYGGFGHTRVLGVNFANRSDLFTALNKLKGECKIIRASDYDGSELSKNIYAYFWRRAISPQTQRIIVGLDIALAVLERDYVKELMKNLQRSEIAAIFVCECQNIFEDLDRNSDLRFQDYLFSVEGDNQFFSSEIFFAPASYSAPPKAKSLDGWRSWLKYMEENSDSTACDVYVLNSNLKAAFFSGSKYRLSDAPSGSEIVKREFPFVYQSLAEYELGEEIYDELAERLRRETRSHHIIDQEASIVSKFDSFFNSVENFSPFRQELYFIKAKKNHEGLNAYFDLCLQKARNFAQLREHIFLDLAEVSHKNNNFSLYRSQRAELVKDSASDLKTRYCRIIKEQRKPKEAVYYLNDEIPEERELLIDILVNNSFTEDELLKIAEAVSPCRLFAYLKPIDMKGSAETGNNFGNISDEVLSCIDNYFKKYKYYKITNSLPNEFTVTVNNLAEKQFYYDSNIISRSNLLKNIDPNDPRRGFIFADSLGFEYLAYIEAFLQKNYPNVYFTFNLAKASLPSVTSVNKGELSQRFRFIDENTELDFLKHSGLKSGQKDMQNFCIFGELNIIDGILKRACGFINDFDEVYILTDHGSSRLAFIAAKNNLSELVTVEGSEAEHSGRCCRVSEQCDGRDKPDSAISVSWNGCSYWSMQNYDRFKGSKLAGVELHGGAALEEFLIPVICLSGRPLTASSKDAGDTASYRLLTKKLNRREARDGIIELESSVKILSKNTFKLEIYYKNRLIDSVPAAEAEENRILFKVLLTDTGAYRLKLFNKDKEAAIFDFEVTKKLATDRYLDLGL